MTINATATKTDILAPRPQTAQVDYAALSQMVIKRYPNILAELAK